MITKTIKTMIIAVFPFAVSCSAESLRFSEKIKVVSSEPIYKSITTRTPYEECWDEDMNIDLENSPVGSLIGGIPGSILEIRSTDGNFKKTNTTEKNTRVTRCVTKYQKVTDEKLLGYKNIGHYKGKNIIKYSSTPLDSFELNVSADF